MLKRFTYIVLVCGMALAFSETALAGSPVTASFTSEPEGVNVVVRKQKSQKIVGTCTTPCLLKLKTKRDFSVSFKKPEHSSLFTNKGRGIEKDGVLTFHAKLKSMESIREESRQKKATCEAKNLKPKGGEADRNAKPLVRIVTKKPDEISKGESCKLKFDVNTNGNPENIKFLECPNPVFMELSKAVLPKWKYVNRQIDGCAIPKTGVETTITFD